MTQPAPILLEICVDTPAGLEAAIAGGADRIELCAALEVGGLTPSPGLLRLAGERALPVRAMIRPRAGHFVFSAAETYVMLREIDAARAAGMTGVVIGAMTAAGALDVALLGILAAHAEGLDVTLHRAVDLLVDPLAAVDIAVALGLATILTSGGARLAQDGMATIAAMQARAAGRIEILAGSGITAANAADIVAGTGVTAIHASCGRSVEATDAKAVALGFASARQRETDPILVENLRAALAPAR
ncbi:copper homeostasis protein CutC [soil metagenome]